MKSLQIFTKLYRYDYESISQLDDIAKKLFKKKPYYFRTLINVLLSKHHKGFLIILILVFIGIFQFSCLVNQIQVSTYKRFCLNGPIAQNRGASQREICRYDSQV